MFQLEAVLTEKAPDPTDLEALAQWCDRKAIAALELHDEALAGDDPDTAQRLGHLHDVAVAMSRRLRRGPGA
jgi:hypothetical protein